MRTALLCVFLSVSLFSAGGSFAQTTWVVDQAGGGDFLTIQEGIDAASDGDTVLVRDGVYGGDISPNGKGILIESESGPESTIVEEQMAGAGFLFTHGETENCVLRGFSVRHIGLALESNTGIMIRDSSPQIENCTVTGFVGIEEFPDTPVRIEGGSPTLVNCKIINNTCGWPGHAVSIVDSSVMMEKCTVSGNYAGGGYRFNYGAGIYVVRSSMILRESIIVDNHLVYTSPGEGAGIYAIDASLSITNCVIADNRCDSPFSGGSGGGIRLASGSATVLNSTIVNNRIVTGQYRWTYGGGLSADGSVVLQNCLLWGNLACPSGTGLSEPQQVYVGAGRTTVSHSDIEDGTDGFLLDPGATLEWLEGNLNQDPRFVGGSDYHLLRDSPCIDSGVEAGVSEDVDGDPRPQGGGYDIGADEYPSGCSDNDLDGYGNPESPTCASPGLDCDDNPADDPEGCASCLCGVQTCAVCARCIHPGGREFIGDGNDSNCNGSADCFIATASFGTEMDGKIHVLRNFRDSYLVTSQNGRDFVDAYYKTSPPIAEYIANRRWLRALVRTLLLPVIGLALLFT
jgi:hypothetical protein